VPQARSRGRTDSSPRRGTRRPPLAQASTRVVRPPRRRTWLSRLAGLGNIAVWRDRLVPGLRLRGSKPHTHLAVPRRGGRPLSRTAHVRRAKRWVGSVGSHRVRGQRPGVGSTQPAVTHHIHTQGGLGSCPSFPFASRRAPSVWARTSSAVANAGVTLAGRDRGAPAERMLSPQQIAELTGLGYTTIRREIQPGNLPCFKLAGKLRVLESAYEQWRTAQPVHSPPRPQRSSPPDRRPARPFSKPGTGSRRRSWLPAKPEGRPMDVVRGDRPRTRGSTRDLDPCSERESRRGDSNPRPHHYE
jgi:predicted DNA-binding transcriptional regulator AlpA